MLWFPITDFRSKDFRPKARPQLRNGHRPTVDVDPKPRIQLMAALAQLVSAELIFRRGMPPYRCADPMAVTLPLLHPPLQPDEASILVTQ
jgi:hypothetical protein